MKKGSGRKETAQPAKREQKTNRVLVKKKQSQIEQGEHKIQFQGTIKRKKTSKAKRKKKHFPRRD